MYKRGAIYTWIIRFFFIALVITLTLTAVVKVQDKTLFTELKTLNDLSYIHQASLSAKHPLHLTYKIPEDYKLTKTENQLSIEHKTKPELIPITFTITKREDIKTSIQDETFKIET